MLFTDSTGRPLTKAELDLLREIVKKHLVEVEHVVESTSVLSSLAEERLRVMQKNRVPLEKFLQKDVPATLRDAVRRFGVSPEHARAIEYAQANTGVYLTNFGSKLTADVARVINNGMRTRQAPERIARDLWQTFGSYNRDWRMIAVTETAQNANNGFLLGVPEGQYVIGLARPDCCLWCGAHMHHKVLKVVAPPPAGEQRDWDREIWVGKSNYGRHQHLREKTTGRVRADHELWKPCVIAHPGCRCRWAHFDPRFQEVRDNKITVKRRTP